jgi:hypothetical protein
MKWILSFLILTTIAAFAAEPEPKPAEVLRADLDFPQRDLATFDLKLAAARAGGVPENETLIPELGAALIHGDAARVRSVVARIDKASVAEPGRIEKFSPTLDLAKKVLVLAETDPAAFAQNIKAMRQSWIREQATATLEDLRLIDAATDQWAIEKNKNGGAIASWADISVYLKKGTRLQQTGASVFGDSYGKQFIVDTFPSIPAETWKQFEGVVAWKFFDPFPIAAEKK